jgi:hypothetical protein
MHGPKKLTVDEGLDALEQLVLNSPASPERVTSESGVHWKKFGNLEPFER